eukprot:8356509-Karenia_brevis.AAC.1
MYGQSRCNCANEVEDSANSGNDCHLLGKNYQYGSKLFGLPDMEVSSDTLMGFPVLSEDVGLGLSS